MSTCVCYLEIQQTHGKQGNARFANEGHLRFVSVAFGFHCRRWKTRYVSELFSFSLSGTVIKFLLLGILNISHRIP